MLGSDVEFSLSGTASDFIDLLVSNMTRNFGTYTAGVVPTTIIKNLTFTYKSCFDALKYICEEFDLEFYFSTTSGRTVNLISSVGDATNLKFEYHAGLKGMKRSMTSGKTIVTRLRAYGAEKNLDFNYGSKRLMLPSATYPGGYTQLNTGTYGVREGYKFFDDIYPHFEGVVTSSSANNIVIDSAIDFDLNSYLISGVTARIVFLDGDLAGYELEISTFNNSTGEITFNTYTDTTTGLVVPSAT